MLGAKRLTLVGTFQNDLLPTFLGSCTSLLASSPTDKLLWPSTTIQTLTPQTLVYHSCILLVSHSGQSTPDLFLGNLYKNNLQDVPTYHPSPAVLFVMFSKYSLSYLLLAAVVHAKYIVPGGRWTDTDGNLVNAHAGNVIVGKDGKFYLFGEYKVQGQTEGGGVSVYSSDDLATWTSHGFALGKLA